MEIFNKILQSYAIYCQKEMVKILKCYLIPKKVITLCLRVQFFWPTLYKNKCTKKKNKRENKYAKFFEYLLHHNLCNVFLNI